MSQVNDLDWWHNGRNWLHWDGGLWKVVTIPVNWERLSTFRPGEPALVSAQFAILREFGDCKVRMVQNGAGDSSVPEV